MLMQALMRLGHVFNAIKNLGFAFRVCWKCAAHVGNFACHVWGS